MSKIPHRCLTRQGYAIHKDKITPEQTKMIIKDLTVKPEVLPAYKEFVKPRPYKIFYQTKDKYYLPRYYAEEKFGNAKFTTFGESKKIDIKCKFDPLPFQQNASTKLDQHFLDTNTSSGKGGVLCIPCGFGKCLAKDTPVMLASGNIKKVQDIKIGELLMGDDSTPRRVLSLARGRELMYRIIPETGDPYVVNESHILSLKDRVTQKVFDICVKDYLQKYQHQHNLMGYRVPVNFQYQRVTQDPYQIAKKLTDHIPDSYKFNSHEVQLLLLRGYAESNGIWKDGNYILVTESMRLSNDLIFVSRCLGLGAKICDQGVHLYGKLGKIGLKDELVDPLLFQIRVDKLDVDDYYGFSIDGNHRFLLGDFQVTHNTYLSLRTSCLLGLKTLVVVNKEFLMDQWVDSIKKFTTARVGILQRDKMEMDNDIVVAMIHSLCLKDYPQHIFQDFGLMILDEVHHLSSEVFCKTLLKVRPPNTLGLSATPERPDKLSHVFYKFIGEIIHREKRTGSNQVIVKQVTVTSTSTHYQTLFMSNNTKNTAGMATAISEFPARNKMLFFVLKELIKQNRTILFLSSRRNHLHEIKDMLDLANLKMPCGRPVTYGFYYGKQQSNKQKHREMLAATAKCDLILGTDAIAKEGLDIPTLNTLVFGTPPGMAVEQAVGRILRKYHKTIYPMVVDVVDRTGNFTKHASERNKWYKGEDYLIQKIKIPLYDDEKMNDYQEKLTGLLNQKNFKSEKDTPEPKEETPNLELCLLDQDNMPRKKVVELKLKSKTSVKAIKKAFFGTKSEDKPTKEYCLLADERAVKPKSSPTTIKKNTFSKCLI